MGATLIASTSARNTVAKAGVFDDDANTVNTNHMQRGNGVFFQWKSGEGLALVLRSNFSGSQVDTTVLRADWNLDKLDGTGASAKTLVPTDENTYVFEWSAFGGSIIQAGFMQDGVPVWCHRFVNVRFGCAALPLRWEIGRIDAALATTENDAASMIQGAGSIFIRGLHDSPVVTRALTSSAVRSVTATTGPVPVIFMLLRPYTGYAKLLLRRMSITNLDQGVARWSLVWKTSGVTGISLLGVSNSYVTYATTSAVGTSAGTGFVVASGFLGHGVTTHAFDEKGVCIEANTAGGGDNLVLYVEYLRGVVTVVPSIEWIEVE